MEIPKSKPGDALDLEQWHALLLLQERESRRLETDLLNQYSIFEPGAAKEEKMESVLLQGPGQDEEYSRVLGCMMGMVIGDSWGHLFEFFPAHFGHLQQGATAKKPAWASWLPTVAEKKFDPVRSLKDPQPHERLTSLSASEFQQNFVCNTFGLKPGQWTDDSSMGLCIADSLLMRGKFDGTDMRRRFLCWWHLGYNNAFRFDTSRRSRASEGLGGNISESLDECLAAKHPTPFTAAGDEHTSGNGGLIRLAPISICYRHNLAQAIKWAKWSSRTTHQGKEASDCAKILSFICVHAMKYSKRWDANTAGFAKEFLDGLDFEQLVPCLETDCCKALARSQQVTDWEPDPFNKVPEDQNWNWKHARVGFSPTRLQLNPGYFGSFSMDCLLMSLYCFYHTNSFEECLLKVINCRGDADSTGSVCGQLAGALYGIQAVPKEAIRCVLEWDNHGEVALRAKRLYYMAGQSPHQNTASSQSKTTTVASLDDYNDDPED